jgi:hypothetical protein
MILAAEGIRLNPTFRVKIKSPGQISLFHITIPEEIRKIKKGGMARLPGST